MSHPATTPNIAPHTVPHITELREHLMATLASLRDRDNPMEPDRARAIGQVASVMIDSAKVEVDYIKATGADRSDFLAPAPTPAITHTPAPAQGTLPAWPGTTTRHILKDE